MVFVSASAPRCYAAWLALGLLGALALLAAAPKAVAGGPAGGYHEAPERPPERSSSMDVWAVARTPLHWLRQSSWCFQHLMRLLAERSVWRGDGDVFHKLWPPRPEPEELPPEPPRSSPYGGEAQAGPDRGASAVRVKGWLQWQTQCPEVEPEGRSGWYVVQRGDSLWSIAKAHYGFGGAYLRIARANGQTLHDPSLILPCQQLYLPPGQAALSP